MSSRVPERPQTDWVSKITWTMAVWFGLMLVVSTLFLGIEFYRGSLRGDIAGLAGVMLLGTLSTVIGGLHRERRLLQRIREGRGA